MTEKSSIDIFSENYKKIKENIEAAASNSGRKYEDITLLAATKTVPYEVINYAIKSGITHIGENKVQEFLSKEDFVDKNVHKHFIGHLQSNKVKDIVGRVELIQSVHSLKLARVINEQSEKRGIVTDILAEINIGEEQSKSGFSVDEIFEVAQQLEEFKNIRLKGLMAIPPICEVQQQNIKYFDKMYKLFIDIRAKTKDNNIEILSMGMSDDYECAIECGANMVRLGTALFGRRNYNI